MIDNSRLGVLLFLFFSIGRGVASSNPFYAFSDAYIAKINTEADTWQAGRNFPANVTEEYLRHFIISEPNQLQLETPSPSDRKHSDPNYASVTNIPPFFDARDNWPKCSIIKHVPESGPCPAPQIFAAVAAFSDRRCIVSDGQHDEALSTEYVLSCCKICRYDVKKVCSAGSVYRTWNFLHKRGAVTGGNYPDRKGCQPSTVPPCSHFDSDPSLTSCSKLPSPAPKCHTRCTNSDYDRGFFQDKHRSTLAYWVNEKEEDIKKEILLYGPTSATFVLYDDFFHYKKGVYKHTKSAKSQLYLHSAKLIGWGVEDGVPYWLLINTWGPKWGDNGTFKIARGTFECSIEYLIAAGKPKNKK